MSNMMKTVFGRTFSTTARLALIAVVMAMVWASTTALYAQPPIDPTIVPEPAPPADQTYIGVKRCAPCHFTNFMTWKKDKHSGTFDLLTEKYQKDPKCLACHTTGYGTPTGFKDIESTPDMAYNGCEVCHGPGSKHEEVAKPFADVKELSAEQEKLVRDSIWKLQPGNVCVRCHTQKAHKENETPEELRTK